MRTLTLFTCVSAAALLSACTMPDSGYYDANGNYVPPANPLPAQAEAHSPDPGSMHPNYYDQRPTYDYPHHRAYTTTVTTYYDRPGYYDYQGYYVAEPVSTVPDSMYPPRGMCRVWFTDRMVQNQPRIETCEGIRARVPAGAYVIYGG